MWTHPARGRPPLLAALAVAAAEFACPPADVPLLTADEGGCAEQVWYEDLDGDGHGARTVDGCGPRELRVRTAGDCDDADAAVFPGAAESPCDAVDHDCDGLVDPAAFVRGRDAATVADAVAMAGDGDVVLVCPGTWPGRVEVPIGLDVTLASFSGDAGDTALDGEGTHAVIHAWDASRLTVRDLTLRDGLGELQDEGTVGGGAIHALGAELRVDGCRLVDNRSAGGGGAITYQPDPCVAAAGPALWIEDSAFEGNHGGHGGAVAVIGAMDIAVTVRGSTFRGNRADGHGGALALAGARGVRALIADSTLSSNAAEGDGGAVFAGSTGTYDMTLWHVELRSNEALGEGGGLALKAAQETDDAPMRLAVDGCRFEANRSTGKGAGIYVAGALDRYLPVLIRDSEVLASEGGGLYLHPHARLDSDGVDWGAGDDDNSPWDLSAGEIVYDDVDAPATFSCDDEGCAF